MDILKRYNEQEPNIQEQEIVTSQSTLNASKSGFIKFVIKISLGLITNERDARVVLGVFVVILFLITGVAYVNISSSPKPLYKEEIRVPGTFK
mgnify:CR=1 FL=1